jgi:Ca2+-binding RTX toxin-like protein
VLLGGAGDDRLDGGRGGDTLNGGNGTDTLLYTLSGAGVVVDLSTGKGSGGLAEGDRIAGIENVTGSDFGDTLSGDGRSNALTGGDGNDVLLGGKGADILIGGNGDDTISFATSAVGVTIDLAANTASGGDASGDQISGFENIIGSTSGDQLTGSFGNNVLDGGAGDDMLTGGRGKDTLIGGEGDDVICGGGDSDTLTGGNGADTISMAGSIWVLIDLSKNIAQLGNGEQPDKISGFENIIGSDYYDTLIGDSGGNLIDGGKGNDKIQSGAGNDVIIGGWGKEKIDAGDGDDVLTGNQEDDEMTGGLGSDTFKFVSVSDSGTSQGEIDIIWDFKSGSDKLDFSDIDADSSVSGDQAFKFIGGASFSSEGQIRSYQYGSYTLVEINVSGSGGKDMMIALAHGVDVKAGDFIL